MPPAKLVCRPLDASVGRWLVLAVVLVPTFLARLWLIRHFAEPDTDAAGHLGIARAVLQNPTNVALHWVYLPAYHFLLAGLLSLGLSDGGIRLVNCVLAALVPVVLYRYARSRPRARSTDRSEAREVPLVAACLCAVSPLVNLLGTSAQQETLFTLLLLGAVWAIEARRYRVAGALLAVASLVRYETWGAVALVVGVRLLGAFPVVARRLPPPLARANRWPLSVTLPSVIALAAWLFARRRAEGSWFGFLHELCRYTYLQRQTFNRGPLWFPLEQPRFLFGAVIGLLFLVGLRRAFRASHLLPLGVYLFLLGAYELRGALGSARYYESLTPFIALAAAHGVYLVGRRWSWVRAGLFAVASWQLVALSSQLCRWTWPEVGSVASSELRHELQALSEPPSREHGGS